jgi:thiol-disulfide isomerase/thioredoxin
MKPAAQPIPAERLVVAGPDGNALSFADLLGSDGRAVCFAFLHPACPLAQEYAPVLSALAADFGGKGIRFVGVICEYDDLKEVEAYRREYGVTFPIHLDTDFTLAAALDLKKVTPTEIIDCEDWHWFEPKLKVWINDDESNGRQTVKGVLVHSSNIGTYKIFKRIGRDSLLDYAKRFGFGQRWG